MASSGQSGPPGASKRYEKKHYTQEIIDALFHYEIEYRPSVYRPGTIVTWKPRGYLCAFLHGFHRRSLNFEPDNRCYDITIKAIANDGLDYVDSPEQRDYVLFYKDHTNQINGIQKYVVCLALQ